MPRMLVLALTLLLLLAIACGNQGAGVGTATNAAPSRPNDAGERRATVTEPTPESKAIEVAEHIENAREYRAGRQLGLALEELRQALALDPSSGAAQQLQAEIRPQATAQVRDALAQQTAQARDASVQQTAEAQAQRTAVARANTTATAETRARATAQARPLPTAGRAAPSTSCCRVCTTGKACGNSCIAANLNCRAGVGCACNASAPATPLPLARFEDQLRGLIASALPSFEGGETAECQGDDSDGPLASLLA